MKKDLTSKLYVCWGTKCSQLDIRCVMSAAASVKTHPQTERDRMLCNTPRINIQNKHFEKKSPCCKLVSLSVCNFLHCLFCCALKIWYLVLPCGRIIVNSLLAHSCLSISLSLAAQCKCLSSCCGNAASWHPSRSGSACYCSSCHSWRRWHLQAQSHVFCLSLTAFKAIIWSSICYRERVHGGIFFY